MENEASYQLLQEATACCFAEQDQSTTGTHIPLF